MYRFLVLVLLVNAVHCRSKCRGSTCDRQKERERFPEEPFYKLAHRVIAMERKFENYCRDHATTPVKEVYGTDSYKLTYTVKDFEMKDFTIKVMHRAIHVCAEHYNGNAVKTFKDVKLLPDNLNTLEASWSFEDGELGITFPYMTALGTDILKTCGNINYAVVTIPMGNKEKEKEKEKEKKGDDGEKSQDKAAAPDEPSSKA